MQIWELDTADAVQELGNVYATACSLSCDKERAVIATVDEFDPTMETYWGKSMIELSLLDKLELFYSKTLHTNKISYILLQSYFSE